MKKYIVIVLSLIVTFLQAKIFDVNTIKELENYLAKEDCLVIFDIDNTLLEPTQEIGSDQWFEYRLKTLKNSGLDDNKALRKAYDEWHRIQSVIDVKLVEKETKDILDKVKNKFKTIALTTRGFQISHETIKALESLGIDFGAESYISEGLFFKNGDCNIMHSGVLYAQGILFTNNTHKGEALFKFLDLTGKKVKHIVFVNDKRSHLEQVQKSSDQRNIDFTGIRYGFTDDKVRKFNPNMAKLEITKLEKILQK